MYTIAGKKWAESSSIRNSGDARIIGGYMKIERVDIETALSRDNFADLVLHEFGHLVGLGTRWREDDLGDVMRLADDREGTYTGTKALAAWRDMNCTGDLPLSPDMEHWSEQCLNNELMTPKLREGQKALISSITMGALEDLGYEVNHAEQDDFGLDNLGDCEGYCPAGAGNRWDRRLGSSSLAANYQLSQEAEISLLLSAAESFRGHMMTKEVRSGDFVRDSVSYIYEEHGKYFSRIIHKHQVEHLL